MLDVVFAVTVTLTVAVCVNDPETPVTVKLNDDGVTEGLKLTFNVELPVGVTDVALREVETPLGGADKLSITSELNPPSEFTVTRAAPEPPTATLTGAIAAKEKSCTYNVKFCIAAEPMPLLALN